MPFKSQAQRRYMFSQHPEMAKEWAAHTPEGKKLPEKVAAFSDEVQKIGRAGGWKWIHDRAEHILAKDPDIKKSTAFAVATEQSHSLGKTPKGYGTAKGRSEAKAKYDTPKDDVQQANPGDLTTSKLPDEPKREWKGTHFVEKKSFDEIAYEAFGDELEQILKQAGLGDVLKQVAMKEVPGTKPWLLGKGPTKEVIGKSMPKIPGYTGGRASPGVYDVSQMAHQMGV